MFTRFNRIHERERQTAGHTDRQYDTIVCIKFLTCSKKLTGIQLSLPNGINKKN